MRTITLNGSWKLQKAGSKEKIPARVPGDVVADLLKARKIPDPFHRDNETGMAWIGETGWTYSRTVKIPLSLLRNRRIVLACAGLATRATIRINHREVGKTNDMFKTWEWDVRRYLREGINRIEIHFAPEKKPELATCGIWRDIKLIAFNTVRLTGVAVQQVHRRNRVTLNMAIHAENVPEMLYKFRVTTQLDQTLVAQTQGRIRDRAETKHVIHNPELWWPNTMGKQPLYEVCVELLDVDDRVLDTWTGHIGLRTLTQESLSPFKINGVPFFAKGATWMPSHAALARMTPEYYQERIHDAAAANINMFRLSQSGPQEDGVFYRLCDEYGICLWKTEDDEMSGVPSFPELRTVNRYTRSRDRNISSEVMDHHHSPGVDGGAILKSILGDFLMPLDFETALWLSQIHQGVAAKVACEDSRRNMANGIGAFFRQLNDCRPVASWASLDFQGRWKALHYMARNFFAPVLVSGVLDADKQRVEIHLTCDRLESLSGVLSWLVTDARGKRLRKGSKKVKAPVNASQAVHSLDLAKLVKQPGDKNLLVWLEYKAKGEPVSRNLVLFARPKALELSWEPKIRTALERKRDGSFLVKLSAKRPALWVRLELEGLDAEMSDNFVHLCPGKSVTITIHPKRKTLTAEFRKRLILNSLIDTFEA